MTKRKKQKRTSTRTDNSMSDLMKLTTDTIKIGVVAEVGIGLIGALKK